MIISLELYNYIPLLTKNTEYVKLDLDAIVNVFMGRNGFGKTSLMRMCILGVPETRHFEDGGYRRLIYRDPKTQNVFELYSSYGKEATQSFKLNNKELNEANNQTVQKQLCERYFRINPQYIKYLTGLRAADLFTSMPALKRKELFMTMYPNDVNYPLEVYNKIKAEYRTVSGGIKTQTNRLAEEKERLGEIARLSEEELNIRISNTEDEIKEALLLQGSLQSTTFDDEEHQTLIHKFIRLTNELAHWSIGGPITDEHSVMSEIEYHDNILSHHTKKINILESNVDRISESLSGMNVVKDSLETVTAAYETQDALVKHLSDKSEELKTWFKEDDYYKNLPEISFSYLAGVSPSLILRLNDVVMASSPGLKLNIYQGYLTTLNELTNERRGLSYTLDQLQHELKHYESQDTLECPECHAEFKKGVTKEQIERKRARLVGINADLVKIDESIKIYTHRVEQDQEWFSSMQSLMEYLRGYEVNGQLLHFLKHYEPGSKSLDNAINGLLNVQEYVKNEELLTNAKVEFETLRVRYNALRDNDIATLMYLYDEAELRLGEEQYLAHMAKKNISECKNKLENIRAYYLKVDLLRDLRSQLMRSWGDESSIMLKHSNSNKLSGLMGTKDELVRQLIRSRSAKSVIESIEANLAALKLRAGKLKVLMDGLCPNKGFIAHLMSKFIECVCGNMNVIIKDIFSTPLYVTPCLKTNGDLNYLFPVINGEGKSAKSDDVSDCSGGESDIINFAFRKVLLRYYAPWFPLFMDEVGTKLDEYHQSRFFDYIRRLSLSGDIEQMFLVSHFTTHIQMFDYANVTALNSEGISLPKNVNKNLVIR